MREVGAETRGRTVKLAMPARRGDALEITTEEASRARYRSVELELRDSTSADRQSVTVQVAVPPRPSAAGRRGRG